MSAAAMAQDEQQKELTIEEVAKRLDISYQTARKRIVIKKVIRSRREGLEYRVSEKDLQEYIRRTYGDGEN